MTGSKKTHSEKRRMLRVRLRAQGVSEEEIAIRVEQRRVEQLAARESARGLSSAIQALSQKETEAIWEQPDDRKFRPTTPDPITTGAARATGATAIAARRGKTLTKFQYDALEARRTSDTREIGEAS